MRNRCRPHIDPRQILHNVLEALQSAGIHPAAVMGGSHVIMLCFAIHRRKQTLQDAKLIKQIEQTAHEAGSALGLSAEAVSRLMEAE